MERVSIKDSLNFLSYAKASCGELYTQVIIGQNVGYYDEQQAMRFKTETKSVNIPAGVYVLKINGNLETRNVKIVKM